MTGDDPLGWRLHLSDVVHTHRCCQHLDHSSEFRLIAVDSLDDGHRYCRRCLQMTQKGVPPSGETDV